MLEIECAQTPLWCSISKLMMTESCLAFLKPAFHKHRRLTAPGDGAEVLGWQIQSVQDRAKAQVLAEGKMGREIGGQVDRWTDRRIGR